MWQYTVQTGVKDLHLNSSINFQCDLYVSVRWMAGYTSRNMLPVQVSVF
jgi:hypothetical protein